ncbi:MAG TPA: hypothetical protein VIL04_00430 [Solirubrobacterales bacterium]|jgi:hypothetical protein
MIELSALDPRNPTAYLAALGALRLLVDAGVPGAELGWRRSGAGLYRACVTGGGLRDPDDVVEAVLRANSGRDLTAEFGWDRDVMALAHDDAVQIIDRASSARALQMVGACIAELPLRQNDRVPYTPLRVMPRIGRARFLDTLRRISSGVSESDVREALVGPWTYTKVNNMRWDPGAELPVRAYAAEAPTNFGPKGVAGAVALAAAGLTFFSLVTSGRGAACPGIATRGALTREERRDRWRRFTLPVWTEQLTEKAVAFTLRFAPVHDVTGEPDWERLRRHSIAAVVTFRRETLGSDSETLSWGELIEDPGQISGRGVSEAPHAEVGTRGRAEAAAG